MKTDIKAALSDGQIYDIADDFKGTYVHGGIEFHEFDYAGFARKIEATVLAITGNHEIEMQDTQWWLAELDQYGNPRLVDGAHSNKQGVDKALYILKGIGLTKSCRYAAVKAEFYRPELEAELTSQGINIDALNQCKAMMQSKASLASQSPQDQVKEK